MTNTPNFTTWAPDTLVKYAQEQYQENIDLRHALEQVRLDLKDAMKLVREANKK